MNRPTYAQRRAHLLGQTSRSALAWWQVRRLTPFTLAERKPRGRK